MYFLVTHGSVLYKISATNQVITVSYFQASVIPPLTISLKQCLMFVQKVFSIFIKERWACSACCKLKKGEAVHTTRSANKDHCFYKSYLKGTSALNCWAYGLCCILVCWTVILKEKKHPLYGLLIEETVVEGDRNLSILSKKLHAIFHQNKSSNTCHVIKAHSMCMKQMLFQLLSI